MHKRSGAVLMIVASGACAGLLWASQSLADLIRWPSLSWSSVAAGAAAGVRPQASTTSSDEERSWAGETFGARPWIGAAPRARSRADAEPSTRPFDRAGLAPPSLFAATASSYTTTAPEYLSDPAAAVVGSIAVGDVSGDGWDDLVFLSVRNSRTEVYVAYQGADGRLAPAVKIADSRGALENHLLIADMDRDGIGDIVTTALGSILVLRSNGHGTFFGSLTPASYPNDLVVTDVDRDGYLDVLVDSSNTTATVVHGGRDGFNRTSTLPLPASAERTVGDVTGDGLDDLILGTIFNRPLEEFRVYPALASGGYAAPVVMSLPLGSNHTGSLAVGDFNGDGRGDLALEEVRGEANLHLYLQDAQGKLVASPDLVRQPGYGSLIASDLDRDGRTDLAIAHIGWGYVGYYLQNATGFTPENIITANQYMARVNFFATGDLNHDGCGDLVVSRGSQSPALMYGQNCAPQVMADCRYPAVAVQAPGAAAAGLASPLPPQRNGDARANLADAATRGAGARLGRDWRSVRDASLPNRAGVRALDR